MPPKDHLIFAPHIAFKKEIQIKAITLDDWAQHFDIQNIDFMWLDMQGFELNVLKASSHILKTVKVIATEIAFLEAYAGQYLYKDVKEWLEGQGFTLIAITFDPQNNRSFQGDAIFVRLTSHFS